MTLGLSDEAFLVLTAGKRFAAVRGFKALGSANLLLAIMHVPTCEAKPLIESVSYSNDALNELITDGPIDDPRCIQQIGLDPVVSRVLTDACTKATDLQHQYVSTTHILDALLTIEDEDEGSSFVLNELLIDRAKLRKKVEIQLKLMPRYVACEVVGSEPTQATRTTEEPCISSATKSVEDWFSPEARLTLARAREIADAEGHPSMDPNHLLFALLSEAESAACMALFRLANLPEIRARLKSQIDCTAPIESGEPLTKETLIILEQAFVEARRMGQSIISAEHLLLGIVGSKKASTACEIIEKVACLEHDSLERQIRSAVKAVCTPDKSVCAAEEDPTFNQITEIRITQRALRALSFAYQEALVDKCHQVNNLHVFLGLLLEARISETEFVRQRESDFGQVRSKIRWRLQQQLSRSDDVAVAAPKADASILTMLRHAFRESKGQWHESVVDLNHIGIGLLRLRDPDIDDILHRQQMLPAVLERRLRMCQMYQHIHASDEIAQTTIALADLDSCVAQLLSKSRTSEQEVEAAFLHAASDATLQLLERARSDARRLKQSQVGPEHLMLGVLACMPVALRALPSIKHVEYDDLLDLLSQEAPRGGTRATSNRQFSARAKRILKRSEAEAAALKAMEIDPLHILLALCHEGVSSAKFLFDCMDVNPARLRSELLSPG